MAKDMNTQTLNMLCIDQMRVNLLKHPFGISRGDVRFSWTISADGYNVSQTAYRIRVADSATHMQTGEYLCDSGEIVSADSTAVPLPALLPLLADDSLYYWQVTVRDGEGRWSEPSEPHPFTTAVGEAWAGTDGIWAQGQDDFAFLRTTVDIPEARLRAIDRATVTVTARSPERIRQFVYNLYVNGACIGIGPSRLGKTATEETVLYYNTYDVTPHLRAGKNAIATINYTTDDHAFLCQMTLHFTDGTREIVKSSARDAAAWRGLGGDAMFGKDNSIGTGYYTAHANNIDSALYPHGFAEPDFDDSGWSDVLVGGNVTEGGMILRPSELDPVTRYEADGSTVTVKRMTDNSYVIDLGAEIIGGIRFTADLTGPATLTVHYGEQLNPDGSVKHRMLTSNDYTETWRLTAGAQTVETVDMLAFRYVQIIGSPIEITPDMVRGLEIRADAVCDQAYFSSDNPLLNDIYALMRHTVKVTTQDLYVDSQSRERGAYEGDLIINLLAAYVFGDTYSIGRLTAEYLYTHRTWPAEYFLFTSVFALDDYVATGDDRSLREYYNVLRGRVYGEEKAHPTHGLIATGVSGMSRNDAILVDWPAGERDGYDMEAAYNTVLNCIAVWTYEKLAAIASIVGRNEDVHAFGDRADRLRASLIRHLYDGAKGAFSDGMNEDGTVSTHFSQHATVFALACGVYDSPEMARRLADRIREQGKIRMSVYGAYFLLKGLYESGNGDLANRLLLDGNTSPDARTWAKMLYVLGATITTEAWGEGNKGNMTFSHPWGAAPAYAIKSGIFGIEPTAPAYATFNVRFQTEGIGRAEIAVPTVRGFIHAAFDSVGDVYRASVTVPANTEATVYLPATVGARVTVNGKRVDATRHGGYFAVTVGSGEWHFSIA